MKVEEKRVDILIKEYEMLRNEVLHSLGNKSKAMAYGLTTDAVILSGAAYTIDYNSPYIGFSLLFFVLPFFNTTTLLTLIGEADTVQRIGNHLLKIELKINSLLEDDVITWEIGLRIKPIQFYSHIFPVIFFCLIAVAPSFFINEVLINKPLLKVCNTFKDVCCIVPATTVTIFLIFALWKLRYFKKNSNIVKHH